MASLGMGFGAAAVATGRGSRSALAATAATKSAAGISEKKGLLDWFLGQLQKDQMVETDPILNKVEDKNGGTTRSGGGTTSVAVPNKKSGGFGGLFAKK